MSGRAELRALTGARGIAAWAVVLYHIRLAMDWLPAPIVAALDKGYLAVDFFFLLSGFVIWMTWSERLRAGGWAEVPRFLHKRIARIWPLHIVILAGAALMALSLAAAGRPDPHYPWAALPLHALLLQSWGSGALTLTWNDPAWSISAELAAYLLLPLLAFRMDWRRMPSMVIVGAIALLFFTMTFTLAVRGTRTLGDDIAHFGLLRCLIEFTAGTALADLWARWRDQAMWPTAVSAAVAILAAFGVVAGIVPETFAIPSAFAAVLLALALTAGRPFNALENQVIHRLGEVSYATYLVHYPLWKAFKIAFVSDIHAIPPLLVGLYLALVLTASILLHRWVERPAQRAINGWSPRRSRPRRSPAPS